MANIVAADVTSEGVDKGIFVSDYKNLCSIKLLKQVSELSDMLELA